MVVDLKSLVTCNSSKSIQRRQFVVNEFRFAVAGARLVLWMELNATPWHDVPVDDEPSFSPNNTRLRRILFICCQGSALAFGWNLLFVC